MGHQGLGWDGDDFTPEELAAVRGWLSGKADDHLRRQPGDPEQHHLQANPGPARHHRHVERLTLDRAVAFEHWAGHDLLRRSIFKWLILAATLDAFRAEARDWLEANYPAELLQGRPGAAMTEATMAQPPSAAAKLWRKRIGEKGWGVPTWPKQYGGGGLSPAEARVLQQEMNRIGARNPIGGMGVMMFGPTLLEYGNEEQKQQHIPPIVQGRAAMVPGLLRARRRLRPRLAADQVPRTRATTI